MDNKNPNPDSSTSLQLKEGGGVRSRDNTAHVEAATRQGQATLLINKVLSRIESEQRGIATPYGEPMVEAMRTLSVGMFKDLEGPLREALKILLESGACARQTATHDGSNKKSEIISSSSLEAKAREAEKKDLLTQPRFHK